MRLGSYPCRLTHGSRAASLYKAELINERHRHRLEFNNAYRGQLADAGLVFSGMSPGGDLVEIVELPGHPHFLGCQFHPEFKSRPTSPHPLFSGFVNAAKRWRDTAQSSQETLDAPPSQKLMAVAATPSSS